MLAHHTFEDPSCIIPNKIANNKILNLLDEKDIKNIIIIRNIIISEKHLIGRS